MSDYLDATSILPQSIEHFLRSVFSAHERFIRPNVGPVTVSPAIRHAYVVQITMNGLEGGCAIQIEDDVRIGNEHGMFKEDFVLLAKDPAALQVLDDRLDAVFRFPVERAILRRIVTLLLNTLAARLRDER